MRKSVAPFLMMAQHSGAAPNKLRGEKSRVSFTNLLLYNYNLKVTQTDNIEITCLFICAVSKRLIVLPHLIDFRQSLQMTVVQSTAQMLKRADRADLWRADRVQVPCAHGALCHLVEQEGRSLHNSVTYPWMTSSLIFLLCPIYPSTVIHLIILPPHHRQIQLGCRLSMPIGSSCYLPLCSHGSPQPHMELITVHPFPARG